MQVGFESQWLANLSNAIHRKRHVKCDEQKPFCNRCLSTGRKCDGYVVPPPKKPNPPNRVANPTAPNTTQAIMLPYRPSVEIQGSPTERRNFHYIQAKNLVEVFGICEIYLWNVMILGYSHNQPAVLQSLLAMSAIYEVHERRIQEGKGATTSLETLERHALQQYNKAVKELVRYLGSSDSDQRAVLMSCLIFTWIEIMLNNFETAVRHLNCGINILTDMKANIQRDGGNQASSFPEDPDDIYEFIHRSFMRLKFQTSLDRGAPQESTESGRSVQNPVEGYSTSSTADARRGNSPTSANLPKIAKMVQLIAKVPNIGFTLYEEISRSQAERLQGTDEMFQAGTTGKFQEDEKRQRLTILYIRLSRVMTSLIAEARDMTSEMVNATHFQEVIDLVKEIYTVGRDMETSPTPLDFGVIPPLFLTLLVR